VKTPAARTAVATLCLLTGGGLPLASCATGVLGGSGEPDAAGPQDGAQDEAEAAQDANAGNDAPVTPPRDAAPAADAVADSTLTDSRPEDSSTIIDAPPTPDAHDAQPDVAADVVDAAVFEAGIPALGMVGQWLCSANTNDTSGSGNDGTGLNVSFVTDRHGYPNSACSFDGTTSYIAVPDAPSLDVTAAWSMSAWVQPSGFAYLAGIASKYQTPYADGPTFRLSAASPYTGIDVDESSEDGGSAAVGGLLSQGTWSQVAVTVSGVTVACYINGSLAYTGTAGYEAQSNTDPFDIGLDFKTRFFAGAIDDVLFYNRTLSAEEVEGIYLAH
jgi:hypothetical protein